jgi:chemotaxis protein histidine kinase CheA
MAKTETSSSSESMLVRSEHLDKLLLLAGEVIVASSNQSLASRNMQELHDRRQTVDRETAESARDLAEATSIISSELHSLVQDIRTVSLRDFSFRARRMVRDVARRTGKNVLFEVAGEDTTVDKAIVDRLYDPISHQLRNAIDHGIEDPLTRERAGKPEQGCVTMRSYNTERETFIEIEDDGAGVDLEKVRQRGIDAGIIDPSEPFSEDDALRVMCAPGISTVAEISEVSGRGVGMDVVMSHISDLGGTVSFQTEKGKGSTFTFRVPLVSAVNILDALVVRAGDFLLAFPIESVIASVSVPREAINSVVGKGETIKHLGHLLPLHNLSRVLDGRPDDSMKEQVISVLIIEHKGKQLAFSVSEFFSPQKLVIIPFEGILKIQGIAGTTVLGGKQLGFIVDIPPLFDRTEGRTGLSARQPVKAEGGDAPAAPETPAARADTRPPGKAETALAGRASEPDEEDAGNGRQYEEARQEFMGEIEKMMSALNDVIFRMESNPGDEELLNNAFRMFHTIKGNFIMMGMSRGGETVHSVESILDRVRSREMEFTPQAMDIVMDGVSYIEEMVRLGRSGQWTDEPGREIMENAAALLPEEQAEAPVIADVKGAEVVLSHEATYRANMHRKQLTPIYQCYLEFTTSIQPAFLVACLIYKRVSETGDVLGSVPALTDVEKGTMEGKFKLQFASELDPDEIERCLRELLTRHYGVQQLELTRFK